VSHSSGLKETLNREVSKGNGEVIYLSDRSVGRDNNLNLIRMIAASLVLVSHAFPIALGPGTAEPLQSLTGKSLGTLSVYVFFAISGFLITMSFDRSSSWLSFLVARFLRLMPGLIVSILIVGLVVGPLVTRLSPEAYFTHPETWSFLARNITLALPQYGLPGVFEETPYPNIEGSIWTLIYEVLCYMGVFALGVVGILGNRLWATGALGLYFIGWLAVHLIEPALLHQLVKLHELSLPFVIGMLFYIWQDRLPLSLIGVGLFCAAAWALAGTGLYELALALALSYATFWLGYVPGGVLRGYNALGDYSYGVYIYAFPIQGLAVWALGPQSPAFNMAVSFPLTVLCGILSWVWIEKPALAFKGWIVARLGGAKAA